MPKRRADDAGAGNSTVDERNNASLSPPLRLLLHTVDGVVPYSTPTLLQQQQQQQQQQHSDKEESSGDEEDSLWLGMAVKDTCVHAVYSNENDATSAATLQQDDDDGDDTKKKKKKKASNPRGYTFTGNNFDVDFWIQPYTRLTVPTFDLWQDQNDQTSASMPERLDKRKNHNSQPNPTITSTDRSVLLWTPNGRNSISPEQYWDAARNGLQSPHAVSLFDMAPPPPPPPLSNHNHNHNNDDMKKHNKSRKRRTTAERRTQQWWKDFQTRAQESTTTTTTTTTTDNDNTTCLWAPISLHDSYTSQQLKEEVDQIIQEHHNATALNNSNNVVLAGIALVGWSQLSTLDHGVELLTTAVVQCCRRQSSSSTPSSSSLQVAILATQSTKQIVAAAAAGAHVIGTNLPTRWAQQQRAFCLPIPNDNYENDEAPPKRQKKKGSQQEESSDTLDDDGCVALSMDGKDENDVSSHPWFRDRRPVSPTASSAAPSTITTQHSRAYVYHLVCAKELNAEIILFQHNLQRLRQLLRYCRRSRAAGGANHSKQEDWVNSLLRPTANNS